VGLVGGGWGGGGGGRVCVCERERERESWMPCQVYTHIRTHTKQNHWNSIHTHMHSHILRHTHLHSHIPHPTHYPPAHTSPPPHTNRVGCCHARTKRWSSTQQATFSPSRGTKLRKKTKKKPDTSNPKPLFLIAYTAVPSKLHPRTRGTKLNLRPTPKRT